MQVPGGGPYNLTGRLTLCGRYDGDPRRYFSGAIAALSLWNTPLWPWQVGDEGGTGSIADTELRV